MIEIPPHILRHAKQQGEQQFAALMEWRLSTDDVAALLGRPTRTIRNWTRAPGRKGVLLPHREFQVGRQRAAAFAYRLQDVESFAAAFGWELDYYTLPRVLQQTYRVGEFTPNLNPSPADVLEGSTR